MAIPVRNEEDRIAACLSALASQIGPGADDFGVVLFLNNCTDRTADVVRGSAVPFHLRVVERNEAHASAGWARRIAMDIASAWLQESNIPNGILLTSDADSRVGMDWVARNVAAIDAGADLVAGRICLEPSEAAELPEGLKVRGRLEARYEAMLIEMEARLDPDPRNPWPTHWSKSGATICVRHAAFLQVGGMPSIPTGEDRAFVDAVRARDLIVRHDCSIEVVTSGRLEGRASGGVADTIKLRCLDPQSFCDDRLERVHRLIGRILWRRRLRRLFRQRRLRATWRWAPALSIAAPEASVLAQSAYFGTAHAGIESASPQLAYQPVQPKDLPRQIAYAAGVLYLLRMADLFHHSSAHRLIAPKLQPQKRSRVAVEGSG